MGIRLTVLDRLSAAILTVIRRCQVEQAKARLAAGDDTICPKTLQPHCYVTFHSAAKGERLECVDCSQLSDVEAALTRPHNRSSMGNSK